MRRLPRADLAGGVLSCETCHGGWQTQCTFCHGGADNTTGAPPAAVFGAMATTSKKVGAHTVHVTATAMKGALGCETCHTKPASALAAGHIDGDLQAEVSPSACGTGSYDAAVGSCNVYCHGSGATPTTTGTATWTGAAATCGSCHTQAGLTGAHAVHLALGFKCNTCHAGTVSAAGAIIGPSLHVNCTKDVQGITTYDGATKTCGPGCHASRTW